MATDDEQRDDLSSPVAESRELAMLREVLNSILSKAAAANTKATCSTIPAEKTRAFTEYMWTFKAAVSLKEAIGRFEQALVSPYGKG